MPHRLSKPNRYIACSASPPLLANLFEVGPDSESQQATIEMLSEDILLNILRHYLDAAPQFWPRLLQICRKWRRIIFASQWDLHLRLFCTPGVPVLKTLDFWPALPIVVQYGGSLVLDPPAPGDEDNIITALKQSDRVSSISLTVASSLLEKLYLIEWPFSELEDLIILSRDSVPSILPSAFRWGPRLRRLHSTGIAFPGLLQLLYSSRNLVDLQLHEDLNPGYPSIVVLTNALSGMVRLRSLSLHFLSTADYVALPPPPWERVILPALTRLNFRGITEYLEDLVARIDAPRLENIEVTLYDEFSNTLSELGEFIDRIETHKSYRQAHIISSERDISISFRVPGASTCLKLQLFCELVSEQLSSMTRIFPAFLYSVEDLRITAKRPSGWIDCLDFRPWLGPINSFTGVKQFHLDGNLSTGIVNAILLDRWRKTALPSLQKLYILHPGPRHAPLREAVVSFMTSRRLSGHPIAVEYEQSCHIGELCDSGTMYTQCHHHPTLTRLD
jgi:hypothetical protein